MRNAAWRWNQREKVMTRTWPAVVFAWAVVASAMLAAQTKQVDFQVPAIVKAETAPEWNALFAGKEGWIGGDGLASATLGPKRILWLFGDSMLGTVKDGKRVGANMVNNAVAVQEGFAKDASIRFIVGKTKDGKPAAFITPADGTGWFWPQSAIRVDNRLFLFLPQIEKTKDTGVFGFKQVGQWLASVKNPDDKPENWRIDQSKVPCADFKEGRERSWGSAVLEDSEFIYVYGYDEMRAKGAGKRQLDCGPCADQGFEQFRGVAVPHDEGLERQAGGRNTPGRWPGDRILRQPAACRKGLRVGVHRERAQRPDPRPVFGDRGRAVVRSGAAV